jgi:amidohydrolase
MTRMEQTDDHRQQLKAALAAALDRAAADLGSFGEDVFEHAELGFREERTATLIADRLRGLGLAPQAGLAVTGVKARLKGARPGPTVCVMGELDGLPVPEHPRADPATGVVHACGHNAQLTHLIGVATALVEADAMHHLAGDVVFFAVPAEEYVDLEWRLEQARNGRIEFLGGKPELLRLGSFDDVDLAMMVHATGSQDDRKLSLRWTANGLVAKRARFVGRAAHAAAAPDRAINALNAATLALQAIHMQRETFRDEDHVRVHPILTRGGAAVNVVPADVRLETFVRGATYAAIADADAKVDRALRAGALGVGAAVEIETLPGYMPLFVDAALAALFKDNALELVGEQGWAELGPISASTDAGDLSHVLPVLHPSHGGCRGTNHGADFQIDDPQDAYITPAKAMAWTIVDLLSDEAAHARRVLDTFRPRLTRATYLTHMRGLARTEHYPPD